MKGKAAPLGEGGEKIFFHFVCWEKRCFLLEPGGRGELGWKDRRKNLWGCGDVGMCTSLV